MAKKKNNSEEFIKEEVITEKNNDLSGLENDIAPKYPLIEENVEIDNVVEEVPEIVEETVPEVMEENIKTNNIEEVSEIIEEAIPEIIEEKPKRTLESLNKSEYRMYLRTGKLPK